MGETMEEKGSAKRLECAAHAAPIWASTWLICVPCWTANIRGDCPAASCTPISLNCAARFAVWAAALFELLFTSLASRRPCRYTKARVLPLETFLPALAVLAANLSMKIAADCVNDVLRWQ